MSHTGIKKPVALILALVIGAILVILGGATFFGGTKIRALFGASAEALAGPESARPDAGAAPR